MEVIGMAKSKGMNKVKIGAIGLVAGVATGAAALALSDKHNRKKVKRALEDAKDNAVDLLDEVEKKTRNARKEAKNKIEEVQRSNNKQL